MTNDEYNAGGREIIEKIRGHLQAGKRVMLCTHTRAIVYSPKHADMFKIGRDGSPLVQHGKRWDDIRYCAIRYEK